VGSRVFDSVPSPLDVLAEAAGRIAGRGGTGEDHHGDSDDDRENARSWSFRGAAVMTGDEDGVHDEAPFAIAAPSFGIAARCLF